MFGSKEYTDEELIIGCIDNDRKFQELLYKKYFSSLMSMCLSYTKDKNIAIEIINMGMLKVFMKIEMYSYKGSLEGWIRKIVFHSLSEYFKRENRYNKTHVHNEDHEETYRQPILENLYYRDLNELSNHIPAASANVFDLYINQGYSHKEIAIKLGISEGTSKWHLSNAREHLKKLIETGDRQSYVG